MASTRTSQTAGEARTTDGAPSGEVEPVISVNSKVADTADPKGGEVETTAADIPKMTELNGIRYVGYADRRYLSVEDLQSLGVDEPKESLEWAAHNGKVVQTSQFNAQTRDILLGMKDFVAE